MTEEWPTRWLRPLKSPGRCHDQRTEAVNKGLNREDEEPGRST